MRKHFKLSPPVILALFILSIALSYAGYRGWDHQKSTGIETPFGAVGGQKDEHECLISAGYSWCEPKTKCMRLWEESCDIDPAEEATTTSAKNTPPRVVPQVN